MKTTLTEPFVINCDANCLIFPLASCNFCKNNCPLSNMIFLHSANDYNKNTSKSIENL